MSRFTLLSLAGPLLALAALWAAPLRVVLIHGDLPDRADVELMRDDPSPEILEEMKKISVGALLFDDVSDREAVHMAEKALVGIVEVGGVTRPVDVPFKPTEKLYGRTTWDLRVCSLVVPAILSRGFEASGDSRFLTAAIDYLSSWIEFEDGMLLPRGLVFNDHAVAARAIVVTELWHQYRNSDLYSTEVASEIVRYIDRLARLLMEPSLYEYRSNHGIMQILAMFHLHIAFPYMESSGDLFEIARGRLFSQLQYFVNEEGVVLEHSPGYQHHASRSLAAAFRYLGLIDEPIPDHLVGKYKKVLTVLAAMQRPDGTLPPIGDTNLSSYGPYPVAEFDDRGIVSRQLGIMPPGANKPGDILMVPAAGYVILWRGLNNWPSGPGLSQTAVHWGRFRTGIHKHADDLGLSIWASGNQWIRSVGYWPYKPGRIAAIGWRGSNAPHWKDEGPSETLYSLLKASSIDDRMAILELMRATHDGRTLDRIIIQLADQYWIVVDSGRAEQSGEMNVAWRLSPRATLASSQATTFKFSQSRKDNMLISLDGTKGWSLVSGDTRSAGVDTRLVGENEIQSGPILLSAASGRQVGLSAVFERVGNGVECQQNAGHELQWTNADNWRLQISSCIGDGISLERRSDEIQTDCDQCGGLAGPRKLAPVIADDDLIERPTRAVLAAEDKFGRPFRTELHKRTKLSLLIFIATIFQLLVLRILNAKRVWPYKVSSAAALICWLGFCFLLTQSSLS
jgi:hypothetical protein